MDLIVKPSNLQEQCLPQTPQTVLLMRNETVVCDGIYLHESDLMLLSVETFISQLHSSESNFFPLLLFPSSNCDSVYGSNLANRSHIVPLIKFNDSAATSGVWADLERRERKNKRQREGWRRGSFFFFKWHKK